MNVLREQMVRRAVTRTQHESQGGAVTVENVRRYLPGPFADDPKLKALEDFGLDAGDIAPYLPSPVEPVEVEPVKDAVSHDPQPEPLTYEQLDSVGLELEHKRVDLRFTYDTAIKDELAARIELDQVARAFMQGFGKPMTPDELLKAHAASEAETRRKIASGELPARRRPTVGPSTLDKFMAAQRGGAPGFAGRGYSRGASPVSKRIMPWARTPQAAGQPGGAPLPKLPSDR